MGGTYPAYETDYIVTVSSIEDILDIMLLCSVVMPVENGLIAAHRSTKSGGNLIVDSAIGSSAMHWMHMARSGEMEHLSAFTEAYKVSRPTTILLEDMTQWPPLAITDKYEVVVKRGKFLPYNALYLLRHYFEDIVVNGERLVRLNGKTYHYPEEDEPEGVYMRTGRFIIEIEKEAFRDVQTLYEKHCFGTL